MCRFYVVCFFFFFFKQKTAYEMLRSLVGSEMCIRDRLYINTGNNIPSCKTLAHSKLSPFTSTNDLIAPATFLPFIIFLLHSASPVPFSFNIYPKYLNLDTCSICSPPNKTSHLGLSSLTIITLLL